MKRVDALEEAIDEQISVHAKLLVVALDDVEKNAILIREALAKKNRGGVNVTEHIRLMREAADIANEADEVLSAMRRINNGAAELKRIPKRK